MNIAELNSNEIVCISGGKKKGGHKSNSVIPYDPSNNNGWELSVGSVANVVIPSILFIAGSWFSLTPLQQMKAPNGTVCGRISYPRLYLGMLSTVAGLIGFNRLLPK